ncbi:hypothetical protein [Nocardia neocaledoniensis]|uniref:hypothetical protein n=1 Tax=Nocardia neocaledoniensis TaxID=236511 RepID=UPI0024560B6C|nr:hypothetical protein [Nocardia neocaledoniensis]
MMNTIRAWFRRPLHQSGAHSRTVDEIAAQLRAERAAAWAEAVEAVLDPPTLRMPRVEVGGPMPLHELDFATRPSVGAR